MAEWLNFLARAIRNPRQIGAVAPSGRRLSAAVAGQVTVLPHQRVLELGAGTGPITRALVNRGISPDRIIAVEAEARFVEQLERSFPGITVLQADAFELSYLELLADVGAIVSGIPLLNFPKHRVAALIDGLLSALPPGAPFAQFSYGISAPALRIPGVTARHVATVWTNVPPAKVWTFTKRERGGTGDGMTGEAE